MAESVKLSEFIAEHQQHLQLQHVAGDPNPVLQPLPGPGFWIGPFTTKQEHCIEVVDSSNLDIFLAWLRIRHVQARNGEPTEQPRIVILSACHEFTDPRLDMLQHCNITAYRSNLTAKPILRDLANSLAAYSSYTSFHAVAINVFGHGVLIAGDSGLGKSAIALELLSRGHALVADDLPTLARMPRSSQVYAICPSLLADLLEVRAMGILDVAKLFGDTASLPLYPVNLVIELIEDYFGNADSRLCPFQQSINILDMDIPRVQVPVRHATHPAVMVEILVKNHVLYNAGDDASQHLIARQRQQLEKQTL